MTSDNFFSDLRKGYTPEEIKAFKEVRKNRRELYSSDFGVKELTRIIKHSGVFSRIENVEDVEYIGRRNQVVDLLDDMGLLDESNLERLVRYMLSLPLMPEWMGEEK